jgi:hypothetical protein
MAPTAHLHVDRFWHLRWMAPSWVPPGSHTSPDTARHRYRPRSRMRAAWLTKRTGPDRTGPDLFLYLKERLRHEVLENGAPLVRLRQARRRVPADHEDDPQRVHVPPGRSQLRHLYGADAQSPHVHLREPRRGEAGGGPAADVGTADATCTLVHNVRAYDGRLACGSIHPYLLRHTTSGGLGTCAEDAKRFSASTSLDSPSARLCRRYLAVVSALLDDLGGHPVRRADESLALAHGVGQLRGHACGGMGRGRTGWPGRGQGQGLGRTRHGRGAVSRSPGALERHPADVRTDPDRAHRLTDPAETE